jgi:hypothetical protein
VPTPEDLAAALARAHDVPVDGLPSAPLLVDYAESGRDGDWSLRSALVRFAQPEPVRAGAVLELVRRTDGALKAHRRRLETAPVPTHPDLGPDCFAAGDGGVALAAQAVVADARAADLGRVLARLPDGTAVVTAYAEATGLGDDDRAAADLLAVAVELDDLARSLVAWAVVHDGPPPVAAVDERAAAAFTRLEQLGVPREDGPRRPPSGRRG